MGLYNWLLSAKTSGSNLLIMPKGTKHNILYTNTSIDKPQEEIWELIQGYTNENFPDDIPETYYRTDFIVLLPPLKYENKFVKGLYMTQGVECIQAQYPEHKKLFMPMEYSMWSSLPWAQSADIYLTSYKNQEREDWFRQKYPDKADKILIPLQDADFTHEYAIAPYTNYNKDIDVIYIARLDEVKNLPLFTRALRIYEEKYGYTLKVVLVTGTQKEDYGEKQMEIVRQMAEEAGGYEELKKYITFLGEVEYGKELCIYFSRSKCAVLTSIFEGKNRMLNEAMCCNVPVVVFKDLCKYTRGESEIFPENAGIYIEEFSAEALADGLHRMMKTYRKFTPRRSYLQNGGRIKFLNKCIDAIPYYRENLPEYEPGRIQENLWVDLAMQANYRLGLHDYIYGVRLDIQHGRFEGKKLPALEFYQRHFNI